MISCIFSNVSERDMDLLFLEEIVASPNFLQIFLSKIDTVNLENATLLSIEQSKTDVQWGESDMTVIVEKSGKKYGLLIEDKIDAQAMQNQSKRYRMRGECGKNKDEYHAFFDFIVAPSSYLAQNNEAKNYHYQVSYEECLQYFQSQTDARSSFKAQQVKQAIDKQKRGYQVIENTAVTDFWDKYITYSEQNYPELQLVSKREPKGSKSRWPQFSTILEKTTVYHKSNNGYVDLEIANAADNIPQLESLLVEAIGNFIAQGITVVPTGKSAAVRIQVQKMDFSQPFEIYTDQLVMCFSAVSKLCDIAKKIAEKNNSTHLILDK